MVNDIIAELVDLDLEPEPESLWWTSTHQKNTMKVENRAETWRTT